MKLRVLLERVPGVLLIVFLLALWEASVRLGWMVSPTWPAFSTVFHTFRENLADGTYLAVIGSSLRRLFIGYFLAVALAVSIGLAMGVWRSFFLLVEPLVEFLRPIPSPAYLPMAILFLGIDDGMKVFMVAFAAFFPILLNTVSGVRSVDPVLLETGKTFGYGRWQIIRKILLPASASFVLTGMRISLAIALIVTVIAEMVAGNSGIGFYVLNAQRSFLVPEMYAGVIALAFVGFGLNKIFVLSGARAAAPATRIAGCRPLRRASRFRPVGRPRARNRDRTRMDPGSGAPRETSARRGGVAGAEQHDIAGIGAEVRAVNLRSLDAFGMAEAIRSGGISAQEVVMAALARARTIGAQLNCYTAVFDEEALAAARSVDARLRAGTPVGPLGGVPVAVKNLFDVSGVVTLAGSKIDREKPPAGQDAAALEASAARRRSSHRHPGHGRICLRLHQ